MGGERRLYVCPECVTGLARTARVGSKAAEELRHEYDGEIRQRDDRLRALGDQLDEQGQEIKRLKDALDRSREERERDVFLTRQIRGLADQLTP